MMTTTTRPVDIIHRCHEMTLDEAQRLSAAVRSVETTATSYATGLRVARGAGIDEIAAAGGNVWRDWISTHDSITSAIELARNEAGERYVGGTDDHWWQTARQAAYDAALAAAGWDLASPHALEPFDPKLYRWWTPERRDSLLEAWLFVFGA